MSLMRSKHYDVCLSLNIKKNHCYQRYLIQLSSERVSIRSGNHLRDIRNSTVHECTFIKLVDKKTIH